MRIIPVLDILNGQAVHARAGDRASYAPLETQLTPGATGNARAIARALRDRFGVRELYLADLDAIMGGMPQRELRRGVVRELAEGRGRGGGGATVWVDGGVATVERARDVAEDGAARIIVALETLSPRCDPRSTLRDLAVAVGPIGPRSAGRSDPGHHSVPRVAFSLDLRAGRPLTSHPALRTLEPVAIAELAAGCGVGSIIVLDLARVGMGAGPDIQMLRVLRRVLPTIELVAGGGVRDAADLRRLADEGADAALVGSALHRRPAGQGSVLGLLSASLPEDVTSPLADD